MTGKEYVLSVLEQVENRNSNEKGRNKRAFGEFF